MDDALFLEISRLGVEDAGWLQYGLLIDACVKNVSAVPPIGECQQANSEQLLIDALERLADVIALVMPGGFDEFRYYLSAAEERAGVCI